MTWCRTCYGPISIADNEPVCQRCGGSGGPAPKPVEERVPKSPQQVAEETAVAQPVFVVKTIVFTIDGESHGEFVFTTNDPQDQVNALIRHIGELLVIAGRNGRSIC